MRVAVVILGGMIFGAGLAVSRMTMPEVVLDFLRFRDLGLVLVMGGGVAIGAVVFTVVRRPWFAATVEPYVTTLDRRSLAGSVLFGVGWGISGVCPGAALASLGTGNAPVAAAVAGMLVGAWLQDRLLPRESGPRT